MKKNTKGQSMFEVVVALFIIAMIVVGIVSLSTTSLSNAVFSRNKNLAGKYSQEAVEWLRSQRERDLSLFLTNTNIPIYCMDTLAWSNTGVCGAAEFISGTIFKREATFTSSTVSLKRIIEVTVKTYWTDSKGYHEAKSVTNFSDIREK